MNEIATTIQVTMPAASNPILSRSLDALLSGAVVGSGETVLLPGKELTHEIRRMAEARLSTLTRSLDGRDKAKIVTAVSAFLAGFPSARQTGDEARAVLTAYVTMLDDFPPWVVTEAFKRWGAAAATEGRVNSLAFPPSAAELREHCQRVVYRYQIERGKISQALSAKMRPADAAEHSRTSAGLDALRDELAASASDGRRKRPMTSEEARVALEKRCADLGIDVDEAMRRTPDQPAGLRKFDMRDLPFLPPRSAA